MLLTSSLTSPAATRRGLAAVTAILATFTLGACTAEQSSQSKDLSGPEGEVQRVITALGDRADDDDAKGICDKLLTAEVRESLSAAGGCEPAVKKAIAQADFVTLNVDTVKIVGNQAIATLVRTDQPQTKERQLVLERPAAGQPWQIAAFGNAAATAVSKNAASPASSTPAGSTP